MNPASRGLFSSFRLLALTKDPLRYDIQGFYAGTAEISIHGYPAGEITESQRNYSLEWLENNPTVFEITM